MVLLMLFPFGRAVTWDWEASSACPFVLFKLVMI
jgi:hypothetical protein